MFRFSFFVRSSNSSSSSAAAMRFIIPPGDLSEVRLHHTIMKQRLSRRGVRQDGPASSKSLPLQALAACGINAHSDAIAESGGKNSKSETTQSKSTRGKLNAAELNDDEIARCLAVLPKYADLATSTLSHTASLRSLARQNYGSATAVHRQEIRNLKTFIYRSGLLDRMNSAEADARNRIGFRQLDEMSLSEVRRRFGHLPEVKIFLKNWAKGFVIDVDQLYRN